MGGAMAISSILNGIAFVLACFIILKAQKLPQKRMLKFFFLMILPLIFSLTSLLYAEDISKNLKAIEKLIFMALTGVSILFVPEKGTLTYKKILLLFAYVVFGIYLLSIFQGIYFYIKTDIFFHHRYSNSFLAVQHNYLSFYGIFAVFIFIREGYQNRKKQILFLHLTMSLIMIGIIFLVSSRLAILCIILGVFCLIVFEIVHSRNLKRTMYLMLVLIVPILLLFISPNTIERFKKLNVADRSPRYLIWDCSEQIIEANISFFKGLGAGNVQKKLDECYTLNNRKVWVGLHSHNQILGNTLSFGYFATSILLISFGIFVFYAISNKNYTLLFFLILIFILGLTENYMQRRYGIFFFTFILCTLIKSKTDPFLSKNP